MKQPRRHRLLLIALYLNVVMLAVLVWSMLGRDSGPSMLPMAFGQVQAQPTIAGGGGVYMMPAQIGPQSYGTYLMDIDSQTLMVYQYSQVDNQLRFKAARSFKWDRRLQNFNTPSPTPAEVEELVKREQQNLRGSTNPGSGTDNK
jgi:hypothetical protein